jgi:hypothetical protein
MNKKEGKGLTSHSRLGTALSNPPKRMPSPQIPQRPTYRLQYASPVMPPAAMSMMHQRPQPSSEWRKAVQSGLDGFLDFEGRSLGRDGRIAGDWGSAIGVG